MGRSHIRKESLGAVLFILPNFLGFLLFTSLPVLASMLIRFTSWDIFAPPKFIGIRNYVELLSFHPIDINAIASTSQKFHLAVFVFLCFSIPAWIGFMIYNYLKERKQRTLIGLALLAVTALVLVPVTSATFHFWTANDPRFWQYCYNTLFLMMAIPVSMFSSLLLAIVLNQRLRGIYIFRLIYYLPTICSGIGIYILWIWIYNPDYGLINSCLRGMFNIEGPKWLQEIACAKPALQLLALGSTV